MPNPKLTLRLPEVRKKTIKIRAAKASKTLSGYLADCSDFYEKNKK